MLEAKLSVDDKCKDVLLTIAVMLLEVKLTDG